MSQRWPNMRPVVLTLLLLPLGLLGPAGRSRAQTQIAPPEVSVDTSDTEAARGSILQVPVSHLVPGNRAIEPDIRNPLADDPKAVERGMKDFIQFNCVGCHANNGAGGMGPSLSDNTWIYGNKPAQIYMTLVQGRPNGMPAFGQVLPDQILWELVTYVQSISQDPSKTFGKTISMKPQSPAIEQVPAEKVQTAHPWDYTEAFHNGQQP
jgi:cytochrome c oxidase cbb3-type subunit 3